MHIFPADVKENTHMHKVLLPLRIFGAVIYSDQRYKKALFGIYVFLSVNFIPICAMQIYALHPDNWSSIGDASVSAATAVLYSSANFLAIGLLFRRKEFVDIITYVARDAKRFYLSTEEPVQELYKQFTSTTKHIFMSIYIPAFFGLILIIPTSTTAFNNNVQGLAEESILDSENVPFLFLMYPFRKATKNYFISYLYPYFACLLGALFVPGWHVTMATLLLYPNYIFKLIKVRLENLDEIPVSTLNEELVSLIKLQIQTKTFVKRLESFISGSVFIDFILFSILICFLLYQISENNNNDTSNSLILLLYFFMTSILQLFYHAIGNEIYYQADTLSTAFYMSSWYTYPLSVQKAGLMIMIGSARPIQMKAVYIDIKLSTFLNIIRASYGYFAMLRSLNRSTK